jgi:Tfp pilus assembly protein PilZ
VSEPWCPGCQTQHGAGEPCPDLSSVIEPERHGWRVLVHTGSRTEVYGVLIAPVGKGLWRARVLTFPRMLWSMPGERGSLKFAGGTAGEVERKAADFIRAYCGARGYTILGEPAVAESAAGADAGLAASSKLQARRRFLRNLPLRFGRDAPRTEGTTADLSQGGMFVVTGSPLSQGAPIKIRIEMDGFSVPLTGKVAWTRTEPEQGRPIGMGVQLTHPPSMYRRYVERLREVEESKHEADQDPTSR